MQDVDIADFVKDLTYIEEYLKESHEQAGREAAHQIINKLAEKIAVITESFIATYKFLFNKTFVKFFIEEIC